MKVIAEKVVAKELEPGDLFSAAGPEYWNNIDGKLSVGEKAYIRTNTPSLEAVDADSYVYRLAIVKEKEDES